MKKTIRLISAILTVLILAGCSGTAALPPRRVGLSLMTVQLPERFTVETATVGSDLVALVRVGDWIGANTDPTSTYFRASILKTFKGDAGDEIVLIQDGNSSVTIEGYPLFTAGNELLLFLKKGTSTDYENAYWMIGSFTAFFDAVRDKSGAYYYMDRYGIFGESVRSCENSFFDKEKMQELYSSGEKADPMMSERRYHFAFSAAELDPMIETAASAE